MVTRAKAAAVRRQLCDSLLHLDARYSALLLQVSAECTALSAGAQLQPLPLGEALTLPDFQVCVFQCLPPAAKHRHARAHEPALSVAACSTASVWYGCIWPSAEMSHVLPGGLLWLHVPYLPKQNDAAGPPWDVCSCCGCMHAPRNMAA